MYFSLSPFFGLPKSPLRRPFCAAQTMVLGHGHRRHSLTSTSCSLPVIFMKDMQERADMRFTRFAGSVRSSTDETRGDEVTREDETVIDSEQGSSTCLHKAVSITWTRKPILGDMANLKFPKSAHAYYFAAASWRGSQPSHPPHLHSGAAVDAGEDHKVCYPGSEASKRV